MRSISRRMLLGGAGQAAAMAAATAVLPRQLLAAADDASESDILLTIVYLNAPKLNFDAKRYREKHIPLLKSLYGPSLERIELRTPRKLPATTFGANRSGGSHVPSQPVNFTPPAAVLAAATLWIRDLKVFGEKTAALQSQLVEDLKETTDATPIVQYDRVAALLGDGHNDIGVDGQVFSTYFPTTDGGKFDAKYYGEKIIPLMVKLYGSKAIRRIQYNLGIKAGGSPPALTASAHFYIRDRAAWDAAGMQAFPQLAAEGPNYTTIAPFVADMEVAGLA
jgi:hypothetical protein